MPTAINTTVKVYKGVPLVKGGTEVLFLSGSSAESALSAGAKDVLTYTQYYYTRENRGAIQIDAPIGDLEGANYVGFMNASHGGKWYFGFIDQIVYINDNNTEIRFTIDPFTTYLGDTDEKEEVFIVRNTPKVDTVGKYLQPDFLPNSVKHLFTSRVDYSLTCDLAEVYFTCASQIGGRIVGLDGQDTGIQVGQVIPGTIDLIHQRGGSVIGMFMAPSAWLTGTLDYPAVRDLGDTVLTPLSQLSGYRWQKTKSGVYSKIVLTTTQGQKSYEIEDFANRDSVTFGKIGLLVPSPMVFIYPKNYKGVEFNLSEGLFMQAPALPATGNAVYTDQESARDAIGIVGGAIGGAMASGGALGSMLGLGGSALGMAGGAIVGAIGGFAKMAVNAYTKAFEAPTVISNGMPVTLQNGNLTAKFVTVSPDQDSLTRIDNYFDYYGYNMGVMTSKNSALDTVNTDNGAYLQTGSEMLVGSEADDELNARLMNGVKIRTQLT